MTVRDWLRVNVNRVVAAADRRLRGEPRTHIAVVGFPRGGTSLLFNMLSTTLPGFRFDDFETRCVERLHRLGDYATKTPLDVLDVPRFPALNGNRKRIIVLAVARDVRDILTSRHPSIPDRYFIGWDASWYPQGPDTDEWGYTAPGVIEIDRAFTAASTVEGVSYTVVRYERLVAEPQAVQAELAEAYGLPFAGQFADFHQDGKRRAYRYEGRFAPRDPALVREDKPVDRSRSGKWRAPEHIDRIREQFDACPALFDILIRDGYEPDRSWFDTLPD